MIGRHTRLLTCLANWNRQDPAAIVPAALKEGIGLYGFTKPGPDSLLPPVETCLSRPVADLAGDARNIAALARAFHAGSPDSGHADTPRSTVPPARPPGTDGR